VIALAREWMRVMAEFLTSTGIRHINEAVCVWLSVCVSVCFCACATLCVSGRGAETTNCISAGE